MEEKSQNYERVEDQPNRRLQPPDEMLISIPATRKGPDLDDNHDRRVTDGEACQLADDELRVRELPQPPENRQPHAVPLRMVELVVGVQRFFPHGRSSDLIQSSVAATLYR